MNTPYSLNRIIIIIISGSVTRTTHELQGQRSTRCTSHSDRIQKLAIWQRGISLHKIEFIYASKIGITIIPSNYSHDSNRSKEL